MKTALTLLLTCCWFLFMSLQCDPDNYKFEYEMAVGETPANLTGLNTEYDDYNSDLPYAARRVTLTYSTNRASTGGHFDFRSVYLDVSYHERDGLVDISVPGNAGFPTYEDAILQLVTTSSDELGPVSYREWERWDYFLYSNNEAGHFEIKMVYNSHGDYISYDGTEGLNGPHTLPLNSGPADNLYPTLTNDGSALLFCSNRGDGSFNIYSMEVDPSRLLHEVLLDEEALKGISIMKDLSSDGNDKCPSITGELLVFSSDREGGMGGFDLYYAVWQGDHWGDPVNFGSEINSAEDDYRPITFNVGEMGAMIFSSNRPGGAGGFDLYAVQIADLSPHLYPEWYRYY